MSPAFGPRCPLEKTGVCLKPSQVTSPRRYGSFSLNLTNSSTTRRPISLKSPADRELFVGYQPIGLVTQSRQKDLQSRFSPARGADSIDRLRAREPFFDQLRDHLGRVLQIGIHGDDRVTTGVRNACQKSFRHPEAAGEGDDLDAWVLPGVFDQE